MFSFRGSDGVQVVGFLILVAGTAMYNELLRGCLPGVPPPVSAEESLEVSSSVMTPQAALAVQLPSHSSLLTTSCLENECLVRNAAMLTVVKLYQEYAHRHLALYLPSASL